MTPCTHRLVRVAWTDADQKAGWGEHRREKPEILYTYGLFVDKDKEYLYIADTHVEGDEWGGINKFPRGSVHEMTTVAKVHCRPKGKRK